MPSDVNDEPEKQPEGQKSCSDRLFCASYDPPPVRDTTKTDLPKPEERPKTGDAAAPGIAPPSPGDAPPEPGTAPPGAGDAPPPAKDAPPAPGKVSPPGDGPAFAKPGTSADLQAQLDKAVKETLALYATTPVAAALGDPAALARLGTAALGSLPSGPKGPPKPGENSRGVTPRGGAPGDGDKPVGSMGEVVFMGPGDKPGNTGKVVDLATKAGSDDSGKRLATSTTINGVGKVDFKATRGNDNRLNSVDMQIGDDKYKLTKGSDGTWNLESASGPKGDDAKARKTLETLGIRPDGKGKFEGQLDITSEGNLRYQNSDKPDRQVTYLGQNGTTAKYDYGDYTRTITEKGGQKSLDAWNGREFVPVNGEIKKTTNKDGSVTTSANLKSGPNAKIERTTHPGDPATGNGKRDELTLTRRTTDGTAGEVSKYDWLDGTKTVDGKTKYLDGTTGKYRDGKKEGNTVTFEPDPGSKATSVTRDAKAGTVTYRGKDGFEVTKNSNTDQVISSATSSGKITLEYDASSGKGNSSVNKLNINGSGFTRIGPNRDTTNNEIAEGRKTLQDFNPKTSELNTYKNDKTGETVKMSVAVGEDGTVKIAREGRRGEERATTHEIKPLGEKSPSKAEDIKKADAELKVKKDATGAPIEYQHAKENLKLSKSEDGSWKAEALDSQKPFSQPTEFQKNVYTSNNLDSSQKLRLVENSKKFDANTKFTDQQKNEVYKHADRLLNGRADSALPANEKAGLADQLFWHINNSDRNDQGLNNTCNTTVLRSLALKDKPEVVAKLAADVANDGKFKTSSGRDINIFADSVRARPGSPESTFPPADGMRSQLGKLWDVSTINAVVQTESNGTKMYTEVAPEHRDDTGGRHIRFKPDGSMEVLHSKSPKGVEKPYDNPHMSSDRIAEAWKHLTGDSLKGRFLAHDNRTINSADVLKFKTQDEFKGHLGKHFDPKNPNHDQALIVQSNTGEMEKIAKNLPTAPPGGEHVWLIKGYDAKSGMVSVQNSWGKGNDIKMHVSDVFNAMQTRSRNPYSDSTFEWKSSNSNGSQRSRRMNG